MTNINRLTPEQEKLPPVNGASLRTTVPSRAPWRALSTSLARVCPFIRTPTEATPATHGGCAARSDTSSTAGSHANQPPWEVALPPSWLDRDRDRMLAEAPK